MFNNTFFWPYTRIQQQFGFFFSSFFLRGLDQFPVVSFMCNTHSAAVKLSSWKNDEFGFTHITDPLDLSLLRVEQED